MTSKDIWVIAKITNNRLQDCTIEVLSDARLLANQFSGKLCAIIIGDYQDNLISIFKGRQVDIVYSLKHLLLNDYTTDGYVIALKQLIYQFRPYMVFGSVASDTDDFLPRLAAHIDSPIFPGCIQVTLDQNQNLLFIRPSHQNKVYNTIQCKGNLPIMATYLPGVIGTGPLSGTDITEMVIFSPKFSRDDIRITPQSIIQGNPKTIDIREANSIVAGGKGACNPLTWKSLEVLAELLDAPIGGTRMALDQNYIKQDRLIGQTGKNTQSNLYLALGISGAYYHLQGINTEHLIVINNDKFAPIFSQCNFGVVGDINKIIPLLCKLIEQKSNIQ